MIQNLVVISDAQRENSVFMCFLLIFEKNSFLNTNLITLTFFTIDSYFEGLSYCRKKKNEDELHYKIVAIPEKVFMKTRIKKKKSYLISLSLEVD